MASHYLSTPAHFYVLLILLNFSILTVAITIRNDSNSIQLASNDYGNIFHEIPLGVVYPSSAKDIMSLIRSSYSRGSAPLTIAARGQGHSIRGQAMARDGAVVDMKSLRSKDGDRIMVSLSGSYADVGGEQLWIDVLNATLKHGLAPVSWTNYLYLSVGGTLSNGGISGHAFLHGPQINNVVELDVITGKGEFITCSRDKNPELFYGVLGGLGQFGIITRARIILQKAPTRAKWARVLYSNFSTFSRDQEHLITIINGPSYVEGQIITNENTTNGWRSFFSSSSNQSDIASIVKKQGLIYSLEFVNYYNNQTANTVDKEFEMLLEELNFIPGFIFTTDASYYDFLTRLGNMENQPAGPLQSHPSLTLFIPNSNILDFNAGVIATIIPRFNDTLTAYFSLYPMNRNKWDDRMSAVTPNEDVFYGLSLLHTTPANQYQIIDEMNNQILEFCERNGMKVKQYLPHYESKQDWVKHYGYKWEIIQRRKAMFDPKMILSPGQRIFN